MKTLKGLKGQEVIKGFYKAGGEPRKGKGDHINIKMPNGQLITIPISGDVKLGLLKAAIRKVGLTEVKFLKYIEDLS